MSDNDFIIHHDEPEKKHDEPAKNETEEQANNKLETLQGMIEKSIMATYASNGELSDMVDNLITMVQNMSPSEFAQEHYCKQIQEITNRVTNSVQAKMQDMIQKALSKLNGLLAPIQSIINANPTDLGSVISFCTSVISFFSTLYDLLFGLVNNLTKLLTTLQKLTQVPILLASKATELGCNFNKKD